MNAPTASIVVVGDEILAGHTQDTNSHWVAVRLHETGVDLRRVEVVPDEPGVIAEAVRRHAADAPEFVFVMGGLGPTPDDRTYEAVARALGVALEVRPEHETWLRERARSRGLADEPWADVSRNEGMRRMIRLPAGSEALDNPVGAALGCVARLGEARVVVLPGVPRELRAMFDQAFAPRHLGGFRPGTVTREVEARGAEAELWDVLAAVEKDTPDVRVGSYPRDETGRLLLRVTGPPGRVDAVVERLRRAVENMRSGRLRVLGPRSEAERGS